MTPDLVASRARHLAALRAATGRSDFGATHMGGGAAV